jgi:hypothetical protein
MTEDNTTQPTQCRICKSEMNQGAVFCLHCKSYQNWRRYLNLSSSVLALLVALVSVLSATLPQIIQSLEQQNSILQCSLVESDNAAFIVLVVNQGNRRAVISKTTLLLDTNEAFRLAINDSSRIVAAGEVRDLVIRANESRAADLKYLLSLKYWNGENNDRVDRGDAGSNSLELEVIHFDGQKEIFIAPIPEPEFKRFLNAVFPNRSIPGPPIPREPD